MDVSILKGKTLSDVIISHTFYGDTITFEVMGLDNEQYFMHHEQDCCEYVYIEDVIGNMRDLIGYPLLMAEKMTKSGDGDEYTEWTFYKFATIKGYVTIRWCGTSNGYYSVDVEFSKLKPEEVQDGRT